MASRSSWCGPGRASIVVSGAVVSPAPRRSPTRRTPAWRRRCPGRRSRAPRTCVCRGRGPGTRPGWCRRSTRRRRACTRNVRSGPGVALSLPLNTNRRVGRRRRDSGNSRIVVLGATVSGPVAPRHELDGPRRSSRAWRPRSSAGSMRAHLEVVRAGLEAVESDRAGTPPSRRRPVRLGVRRLRRERVVRVRPSGGSSGSPADRVGSGVEAALEAQGGQRRMASVRGERERLPTCCCAGRSARRRSGSPARSVSGADRSGASPEPQTTPEHVAGPRCCRWPGCRRRRRRPRREMPRPALWWARVVGDAVPAAGDRDAVGRVLVGPVALDDAGRRSGCRARRTRRPRWRCLCRLSGVRCCPVMRRFDPLTIAMPAWSDSDRSLFVVDEVVRSGRLDAARVEAHVVVVHDAVVGVVEHDAAVGPWWAVLPTISVAGRVLHRDAGVAVAVQVLASIGCRSSPR